jgi:hypothetical protein
MTTVMMAIAVMVVVTVIPWRAAERRERRVAAAGIRPWSWRYLR